jgi:2-polyprenyl-3-methyl-5-hydroxy-6-metoxy-1,4-benzoquinol methylase
MNSENIIIDLGLHPFADSFIKKNKLAEGEKIFPLRCYLDTKKGHIRTSIVTNDFQRYNEHDYSYTSSNSLYAKTYWVNYATSLIKDLNINPNTQICEIGSNDGFLLRQFKKKTKNVIGIDASKTMCELARKSGVKTYNFIFNKKNVKKISQIKSDIIIANNVLNHSNDPVDFIKSVKKCIKKKGIFVFEVPYWLRLVKEKKFDQIYHEHISYFTVKSSYNYLKNCGFEIFKIHFSEYHGGSLRIYSTLIKKKKLLYDIKKYIKIEEKNKIFKKKKYVKLSKYIQKKKFLFNRKLISYKIRGYKIIGLGAAAKANTLLNYLGVNKETIDFVTDKSKLKIGKFMPLSRIPIFSDNKIKKAGKKVIVIPLAWNLKNFLKEKILKLNGNVKFLEF